MLNSRYPYLLALIFAVCLCACSGGGDQFTGYQREYIGQAAIGSAITKKVILRNESMSDVQHILGLNFETGTNSDGHFRIDKVELGGVALNPKDKDITVPVGSILQIYVTYQPLKIDTTVANYGGWSTGSEEPFVPHDPAADEQSAVKAMKALISKDDSFDPNTLSKPVAGKHGIHRAVIAAVYDQPNAGEVQIEVVGDVVPGPNGEISAAGGSSGECPSTTGILCYKGGFSMELPELMTTGPRQLQMTGPAVFGISGSNVTLDMGAFPSVLLVLKGNGPGEPLEGKPINAVSIVVSGAEGVKATGTFDGSKLQVNGVVFRIRVVLGEITEKDINPGLQAAVDFNVKDLTMTTSKPYTNGSITLNVQTQLAKEPSGNAMFDQFLGGATVKVTMDGTLTSQ